MLWIIGQISRAAFLLHEIEAFITQAPQTPLLLFENPDQRAQRLIDRFSYTKSRPSTVPNPPWSVLPFPWVHHVAAGSSPEVEIRPGLSHPVAVSLAAFLVRVKGFPG